MKYERIYPYTVNLEDTLIQILEYMEDRQDVIDSETGPSPNKEMNHASDIRQLLWQVEINESDLKKRLLECARNLGHPAYDHSYSTHEAIDKLREETLDFLGVPKT
jgi:hypothetical protein